MGFSSRPVLWGCFHPVSERRDIPSGRDDFLHVNRNRRDIPARRNHEKQALRNAKTTMSAVNKFGLLKKQKETIMIGLMMIECWVILIERGVLF